MQVFFIQAKHPFSLDYFHIVCFFLGQTLHDMEHLNEMSNGNTHWSGVLEGATYDNFIENSRASTRSKSGLDFRVHWKFIAQMLLVSNST